MTKAPTNACVPLVAGTAGTQGNPAPKESEVIASLTTSSGLLAYSDNNCTTAIGTLTIPAYVGFKHFFVKSASDGTYTVAAKDSDTSTTLSEASLDITLSASVSGPTITAIQSAYGGGTATQLALLLPAQIVTQT